MIGASAEVAILKLFCIFNNFVSFSRRKYPAANLENFSLYFGVYNINSGLATSQFQLCQNSYQYSWIVLSAAAA